MNDERMPLRVACAVEAAELAFACIPNRLIQLFAWPRMGGRSSATFMTARVSSTWLEADLCYGSGRNEAIFFSEAWRCTAN